MLYQDAFKTAVRGLTHGKLRSALTMLGIVIGIASVITLMSLGRSAQELILGQVQSVGSDLIFVIPGAPKNGKFSPPASSQGVIITSLRERDADALRRDPSIKTVAPILNGQADVVYGTNTATENFQGITPDMFVLRNLEVKPGGALFTDIDVRAGAHVAVIGPDLADTLFGVYTSPIGKSIRVKGVSFRVVGVLSKGGMAPFGVDQGSVVFVPITVAQHELLGITYFNAIFIQADPQYTIDFVKGRVSFIVGQNHGIMNPDKYDFAVETQADILSILDTITSALTLFLAAVASISLIVGGIGIMNIMLVSVSERTREIGLRKAVGATNRDILQQFLVESVLLTLVGGVIGILIGACVVSLMYVAVSNFSTLDWVFAFPLSAVLLGLLVSSAAGIVFGLYPARKAARKNPIDALRYE